MEYRGVVYDVGLRFTVGNPYSVENFDMDLVTYDIDTIATELQCNAIRVEGEEIERLVAAARIAHLAGLIIFFNPWKMNVPITELPVYFAQAARAAEQLRIEGADIIFVAGCEISLFNEGIFAGSTVIDRIQGVIELGAAAESNDHGLINAKAAILNDALKQIATGVREAFKGKVTYSAGMWEKVDWGLFDIVGIDHYRSTETAEQYVKTLDHYRLDKPLVVMEVGSCAYEGAGRLGAGGFMLLEGTNPDGTGIFKDGIVPTRSEREQADYIEEQLNLLTSSNIDGVFIFVFSFPTFPHAEGARDFDMMSFSLVKTYPKGHAKGQGVPPWEPKEAFHRIARFYQRVPSR
ncbi:hypothetical protein KUD97_01455 [Desulfovibrio desulfuricans]|uniref:hypothetical protein n=1 Tax=Desulfovibrio desulfuricans TaxID=876 RepID=UPI001F452AD6|nr:hypothetical protein [Desulfovibrio desulfuricans]UIB00368.1 hypothetical protein KUD97_01455 [Desulfovibrio desulfuricans]